MYIQNPTETLYCVTDIMSNSAIMQFLQHIARCGDVIKVNEGQQLTKH